MELPIENFSSYRIVDSLDELMGPGSRILRLSPERTERAPLVVAGDQPRLRFEDNAAPVELRCVKVARALCVRRGLIVDLDTKRVLPDLFHKPPRILPRSVDVDLPALNDGDRPLDWDLVTARTETGPGFYADSLHLGYGHVLLEGLSRCWALEHLPPAEGVVVTNKRGPFIYWPWFEALGIHGKRLRSTREGLLRIDDLLVPSPSYVLDRGMSPRFHELTRGIAERMGIAGGCARLFVSRRGASKRRLVNEEEIEALFEARGFRIFHPEEHTVEEQVRAFAGASLVAGPVGSGLYSVAFSPPSTRLIVLAPDEFYTRNDLILASARDHPPVFAFGRSEEQGRRNAMVAEWHLDPATAGLALERALTM